MRRPVGPMAARQYQAQAPAFAQQQPGFGQQLAQKAAQDVAAKQVAKLGLGAAGTAMGGPLGGAVGNAAGEMVGPLAGQLVGSLFNKGGQVGNPMYLDDGGNVQDDFYNNYYNWNKDNKAEKIQEFADKHSLTFDSVQEAYDNGDADDGFVALPKAKPVVETPVVEDVVEDVATPTPTPAPRAQGGKSGGYGEWNIPLGQLGGWDIGTSGNWSGATKMNDGSRQKSNYNVGLNASKGIDFNSLFGGTALADSAAAGEQFRKDSGGMDSASLMALGMSEDEAIDAMLAGEIPAKYRAGGGAVYKDGGGSVEGKKSIWDTIKDKVTGDFSKRKNLMGGGEQKPQYKDIGGMTPGPLGMPDLLKAGKDKDIAKVALKKKNKNNEEAVEIAYHAPLAPKPTGE